jgi:hypothetical protein
MNIADVYWGADGNSHGDVVGSADRFGISSMDVDLNGTMLTVTINTPFAAAGLGSFKPYTDTDLSLKRGIGFGDLFLSSTGWNPDSSGTSYANDDNSTGTQWDFGISLENRWNETTAAALYGLATPDTGGNPDALLSNAFLSSGTSTYRNGQEVAVNTSSSATKLSNNATNTNIASFAASDEWVRFTVNVAGTALAEADSIGLHWAMTCGNDTIEGAYNVSEPSVIALFGLGLLGLGFAGRRKAKS